VDGLLLSEGTYARLADNLPLGVNDAAITLGSLNLKSLAVFVAAIRPADEPSGKPTPMSGNISVENYCKSLIFLLVKTQLNKLQHTIENLPGLGPVHLR
jgi:hypothetical protein